MREVRRHFVDAPGSSQIHIAVQVFSQRTHVVTGQAFVNGEVLKMRLGRVSLGDDSDATLRRCNPNSALTVGMQSRHQTYRQTCRDLAKATVRIAQNAAVMQTQPNRSGLIFSKSGHSLFRPEAVCFREIMKGARAPVPGAEPPPAGIAVAGTDPECALRILENVKDLIALQAVMGGVNVEQASLIHSR